MNDPHVAVLQYRLVTESTLSFQSPPLLDHESEVLRLRLENGLLRIELKSHFPSENKARAQVEPFLRAWEIHAGLVYGRPSMSFKFDRSEIIDRNPPPRGTTQTIELQGIATLEMFGTATLTVNRRKYPDPPSGFVTSPDVETMWIRWTGYLAGREPLTTMGYMCLTVLEASAGGRDEAAERYKIDVEVLRKLGFLTSEVGDQQTARKKTSRNAYRRHTGAEQAWVESVIQALIRRVGECAFDPDASHPILAMKDFPVLT